MVNLESSREEIRARFPKLSEKERSHNVALFKKFDLDRDGFLNPTELQNLLKTFSFRHDENAVKEIIGDIGDAKGISFESFIKHHFAQDIKKKTATLKAARAMQNIKDGASPASLFELTVDRIPDKDALIFEDQRWTFRKLDQEANQIAHWLSSIGLKKGDFVAIDMDNRPEFLSSWLGVSKIGGTSALINHNLKGKSLVHCIKISTANTFIFGIELASYVSEIADELKNFGMKLFCHGGDVGFATRIDDVLKSFPTSRPPKVKVSISDPWSLIYTSGTTGLPKAAVVRNSRFWGAATFYSTQNEVTEKDIIYNTLPLYHSAGGSISTGMCFYTGATMVIRRKFSVNAFWDEIRKYDCTIFQYIGELCRYLLSVPPSPLDQTHKIRIAVGNGLRPDIWGEFQSRFAIPEISEFYAATEGNANLWHLVSGELGRGAIGHMGYLSQRENSHLKLVKFDVEKEIPIRGPDGFCIECKFNETGELLGRIIEQNPSRDFAGYYGNKEGTEKKIIRDAFVKGDKYFRTGDLIRRDEEGFFYFVDRIGDTFRWKGENVSTNEVAETISLFPGVKETNVYGVQIPGYDGRAGMAALVIDDSLDFQKLGRYVSEKLPPYSIPLFLRILPQISITGTFKHQKVELRNEGYDQSKFKDPIYFFNSTKKEYQRFTSSTDLNAIVSGKSKL